MRRNTRAYDTSGNNQEIWYLRWGATKGEWVLKEKTNSLEMITDENDVRPGDTVYIKPMFSGRFYETNFSHLVHIDTIKDYVKAKRLWRKRK